jgi:hypothetical protein
MGNDRPIVVVRQNWRAVELKVPVLNTSTDPRSGERTEKLTDYTIVDEKGSFTIKWGPDQQ